VAARLNKLLEGERAGTMGVLDMNTVVGEELRAVLDTVAKDEARFCSMLRRHLVRHGYEPSKEVGVFYEKLAKRRTLEDKLRLLDRGQSAVVRALDDLVPSISDVALREDLEEMRDTHIRNIEACAKYLNG
jgi:rubrerythrin